MIGGHEDLFVGAVAILLGVFMLGSALTNWDWYYSVPTARWLQRRFGRTGARIVHTLLGFGLIVLGLAITQGFRWQLLGD